MTAASDRVRVRVPIERGRGTQSRHDRVGRSGTQWNPKGVYTIGGQP
jgi:hypothetical protein